MKEFWWGSFLLLKPGSAKVSSSLMPAAWSFFSPVLKILALLTALQASRTAMLFTWYGAGARWDGIALMMGVLIFFQSAVVSGCLSVSMVWL